MKTKQSCHDGRVFTSWRIIMRNFNIDFRQWVTCPNVNTIQFGGRKCSWNLAWFTRPLTPGRACAWRHQKGSGTGDGVGETGRATVSHSDYKMFKGVNLRCFSTPLPSPKEPGGGTPYNGLYGEAPPERGTFFRLQVYKRVGISQV